jgi:glycosyltransferase involved in cell wall biosynthesis
LAKAFLETMAKISVIIITKNEEKMLPDCLVSVEFATEVIVVDTGNTDRTNQIAIDSGARVIKSAGDDYSKFRNDGLAQAVGDWVLYIDADERVTPLLRNEISEVIKNASVSAFAIPRKNIFLGRHMQNGGWGGDYVKRLFKRKSLKNWKNPLHEEPVFDGNLGKLENELVHFSHRDLSSMLEKTLGFTTYEANLRYESDHPVIVPWRIVRVMFTEFWNRFVKLSAGQDGVEGVIDGMFQVFNTFVIYARLWELQRTSK